MLSIQIKDLKINGKQLLKKFEEKFQIGELAYLRGSTGCGKTVLLQTIIGFNTEMKLLNCERNVTFSNTKLDITNADSYFSYSTQEPEDQFLFNTVRNEIFIELNKQENIQKANHLLKVFDLDKYKEKSLTDLSTGQRKLVSLIGSLTTDKEIIILDEPLANLDKRNKERVKEVLKQVKEDKIIICAGHESRLEGITDKQLFFNKKTKILSEKKTTKKEYDRVNNQGYVEEDILIRMKNVNYTYPDNTLALKQINLTLSKQNIIGISGNNGDGKTSLIELLLGLRKKDSGKIQRKITDFSYIQQEPNKQLFTNSVLEELQFESETNKNPKELAKKINLESELESHPQFLSRGQKQALLIMASIAREPDLLVIDEPFSGLDDTKIEIVKDLLITFIKDGKGTIILSDQESDILTTICNKLICLRNGSIVEKRRESSI